MCVEFVQSADGKWYAVNHDLAVADASEQLYVIMSAVNTGRRPVVWEGWGGNYHKPVNGKTSFAIIPRNLPRKLEEGESHSELTNLEDDLQPASKNVKRLFLWDATGKKWKLSWWKFESTQERGACCYRRGIILEKKRFGTRNVSFNRLCGLIPTVERG